MKQAKELNQAKTSFALAWNNASMILRKDAWVFGPAIASSLLLYGSFFPLSWGWLGWFCLVPLLIVASSNANTGMKYLAFWICGLCFFTPALQWMRLADPRMYITWLALSLYCSSFFPLTLYFWRFFKASSTALSFPIAWTLVEFLRSNLMEGFSWYLLGHSQHDFLHLIQFSDFAGAYGVTFLVAMANGLLIDLITTHPRKQLLIPATVFIAWFLSALVYGDFRLRQPQGNSADFPVCASLQGNVDQSLRNDASKSRYATDPYLGLSDLASTHSPDLIIWPETSYSREWHSVSSRVQEDKIPKDWQTILRLQKGLGEEARKRWGSSILLGLNSQVLYPEGTKRFNSALLVQPDGNIGGRYDKIHRVPFGEFIPFKDFLPFLKRFAPYDFEYSISPGEGYPLLNFTTLNAKKPFSFATLICYEDTDPNVALPFFSSTRKPDFFVNISNDGWFKGSEEHEQHLASARFRSIETRRSLIRSVNMGISCVVDGCGRILIPESKSEDPKTGSILWKVTYPMTGTRSLPVHEWNKFKAVQGALIASVPIDSRFGLYTVTGDAPWYLGWAYLIWLAWVRPRFSENHATESRT